MTTGPTWEEIVNQVTIASNYVQLQDSAAKWGNAFDRIGAVRQALEALAERSTRSWRGADGDAFRGHLRRVTTALGATVRHHRDIQACLVDCGRALETAVRKIPIPSWKYAEVVAAQNGYARTGAVAQVSPGLFWSSLESLAGDRLVGDAYRAAEEFFRNNTEQAQAAYRELHTAYASILTRMPPGTRVEVPRVGGSTAVPPAGARPPGSVAAAGPPAPAGAGPPGQRPATVPAGLGADAAGTGLDGLGGSGLGGSGLDGSGLDGSGLDGSGLDGSGLGGSGLDGSGLGDLGGLGDVGGSGLSGVGGLGGGGSSLGGGLGGGLGVPPIGPSVSPPSGVLGGAAVLPGQLAAGGPAGGGMAAAAAPMGGAGLGHGGERQHRGTALTEEWTFEDDLPPGVLDA